MKNSETSWGGVADWYDEYVEGADSYHQKVIAPHMLRAMKLLPTDRVLDLACGTGFFSRLWATQGCSVMGVDISPELIKKAVAHTEQHKSSQGGVGTVSYHVSSVDDLRDIASNSIDVISLVLAIQNIEKVAGMFKECARVLSSVGRMYIVMNHPTFRIPKKSSWGWDERGGVQYRRIDAYLSESRTAIHMHPGQKDGDTTVSFHRSLQYYVKAWSAQGFLLERLEEWISHKVSEDGARKKEEDRIRKEIPLFLFVSLVRGEVKQLR